MEDKVIKQVCDERHIALEKQLKKIDKNMEILFKRLNWFYIITVSTLAAVIYQIAR